MKQAWKLFSSFACTLHPKWIFGFVLFFVTALFTLLLLPLNIAQAFTHHLVDAQNQYPGIVRTRLDDCSLCHQTDVVNWPNRNTFGQAYAANGYNLAAIEALDSDGDGFSNINEITALSHPGDFNDLPASSGGNSFWVYLPFLLNSPPPPGSGASGQYVIIGWNDLGMHCMDPDYADFSILPPYNTLWAQVIRRGEEPDIVTTGVTVEYRIIDNSYSVVKTDFWDYAHELFDLPQPLLPNIGLTGQGLSGQMHSAGDHFVAEGIPLTEFRDSDYQDRYPYQVAELVAKDSRGTVLATTRTVAPVSTELNCRNCHDDNGSANAGIATGVVKQNILTLHDQEEGTDLMANRPVLCAKCHGSNALGLPGASGLPNLSRAIHGKHSFVDSTPNPTMENTCYQCHPGVETKCMRDIPHQDKTCQNCHGGMSSVADATRQPWLDEPACGNCHDAAHSENAGTLYRMSRGHGGIYCEACHGSPHALYPSQEANDNIQSILLQGHAGKIDTCTVCHTIVPDDDEGPHRDDDDDDDD